MNRPIFSHIIDRAGLHEQSHVFCDRTHGDEVLADMLSSYGKTDAIVLAIPTGWLSVAAVMPERLKIPLEAAAL